MSPAALYRSVLRTPGAARFSVAAAIARFPAPMIGVGTVLMVEATTGSFAAAGRVSAVLALSQALVTPLLARWVDRAGQRRVLVPALVVTTLGILGLGIGGLAQAPEPVLWALAALCGAAQGSYGSYVRARWTHALGADLRLQTALSLEAAIDEFTFVVGPAFATLLATSFFTPLPLLLAAVVGAVGGAVFLSQRATEPPLTPRAEMSPAAGAAGRRRSVLLLPGVWIVATVFVGLGAVFGSADVSTVAFATHQGRPEMAGVMLGCFALGSFLSGVGYGARRWRWSLQARFLTSVLVLAAGVTMFSLASTLPQLAAALILAGFAVSPTAICGNALVQHLVPRARLTEGFAWLGTAMGAGISLGSWIGGWRIDEAGARGGYLVAATVGWVCAVFALVAVRRLRAAAGPHPAPAAVSAADTGAAAEPLAVG